MGPFAGFTSPAATAWGVAAVLAELAVLLPLHLLRALGAGDVKLMAMELLG